MPSSVWSRQTDVSTSSRGVRMRTSIASRCVQLGQKGRQTSITRSVRAGPATLVPGALDRKRVFNLPPCGSTRAGFCPTPSSGRMRRSSSRPRTSPPCLRPSIPPIARPRPSYTPGFNAGRNLLSSGGRKFLTSLRRRSVVAARDATVLGAVKRRAQARAASGFIP